MVNAHYQKQSVDTESYDHLFAKDGDSDNDFQRFYKFEVVPKKKTEFKCTYLVYESDLLDKDTSIAIGQILANILSIGIDLAIAAASNKVSNQDADTTGKKITQEAVKQILKDPKFKKEIEKQTIGPITDWLAGILGPDLFTPFMLNVSFDYRDTSKAPFWTYEFSGKGFSAARRTRARRVPKALTTAPASRTSEDYEFGRPTSRVAAPGPSAGIMKSAIAWSWWKTHPHKANSQGWRSVSLTLAATRNREVKCISESGIFGVSLVRCTCSLKAFDFLTPSLWLGSG